MRVNSTVTPSGVSKADSQVQSQGLLSSVSEQYSDSQWSEQGRLSGSRVRDHSLVRVNSTATPSRVSKEDSQVQSQGLLSSESEQYSDSQ